MSSITVKGRCQDLSVTQAEFADVLSVSIETVKSWEQGKRVPAGLAGKVLLKMVAGPELYTELAS